METGPRLATSFTFNAIDGPGPEQVFGDFVSSGFGITGLRSFFDDFPVWREASGARIRRIGAFVGDKLVATAALRYGQLRLGESQTAIAVVGCVVTDAEYRGQGLASRAVTELLAEATSGGAAIAVLFGSEASLYSRLGFRYAGVQERVGLDTLSLPQSRGFPEVQRGWKPNLFECLQARKGGLVLAPSDAQWVSRHLNSEWFSMGDYNHPTAYACLGKGIDLAGIVHEWGGDSEALQGLLSQLREERSGLQIIGSPDQLRSAGIYSEQSLKEPLCMAKSLRTEWGEAVLASPDFWLWGLDGA